MGNKQLHVAFCGLSGFPLANRAAVNKMSAMAKGLINAGVDARVLNRKGVLDPGDQVEDRPEGEYEGIPYYTASGSLLRPQGFVKRNWLKVYGFFREIGILMRMKRKEGLDVVVLDTPYLSVILMYRILGFLIGYKLVFHYVEMRSEINIDTKPWAEKISHNLTDKYVTKLFDGIMPISSVLTEWVEKQDPSTPLFRLPVLADYNTFDKPKRPEAEPYYLYCGSSAYQEVIYFILEAFEQLPPENDTYLYMVIRGPKEKHKQVLDRLAASPRTDRIKTFSNLPYEELAHKYVDAIGLLIPLRPTVQDAARFPFKVGEYLASKNPIVTTNYGELRAYFRDMDNGLVAEEYDVAQYIEKLQFIYAQPEEARAIGLRGYEMGVENFHFARIGERMRDYLNELVSPDRAVLPKEEVSIS